MPKYKFKWPNLPSPLAQTLCQDLGLDATDNDYAGALRRAYGARPTQEFVRDAWPTLRESWLRTNKESREWVVESLRDIRRERGVLRGRNGQMDYLRSLNMSKNVRQIVWEEFVAIGETDGDDRGTEQPPSTPGRSERPQQGDPPPLKKGNSSTPQGANASTGRTGSTLTLAELEARLWGAANALRGPIDPADFKTYVFPMLFWKWICDTWVHEHAEALATYGDGLTDEIEADYHRFVVPADCLWSDVVTKTDNFGVRITNALGRIEQANPNTLAGVFGDAAWGNKERLPESALVALLDGFNGIRLDPDSVSHDALGHAYEYLLKEFAEASGKKAGEFFTPPAVVHLLVAILDPQPGESVYDPACGSGGMLVETVNAIRRSSADHREVRLFGQEVNLTTSAIARMNLSFHRAVQSEIRRGDTLREPKFRKPCGTLAQYNVVIANPPFSLSNWGADTWVADGRSFCGVPPAKNGDFAWIQHMISSMTDDTGRVGVVMPHGVLFRGGVESKIRQCLIEQDRLEAVVGLPSNLFYSTSIPACLLIFKATKADARRNHLLFVDGSARFTKQRTRNLMTGNDMEAILAAYQTGEDPDGEGGVNVRLVPFDEIKANGFDLNIGRYVRGVAEEAVTLEVALTAYADARTARLEAEQNMFQRLSAAGIEVPGV